jgi:hypothetical protein
VLRQPADSYQDLAWDPNAVEALLSESQEEKLSAAVTETPETLLDDLVNLIETVPDVSVLHCMFIILTYCFIFCLAPRVLTSGTIDFT